MLKQRSIPIYIECDYKCLPKQFKQCMIIICYKDETAKFLLPDRKYPFVDLLACYAFNTCLN
ncbi:hypothetical protein MXB_1175 [Myxobolus squamalis]|nr:hypothetical protein MXB_1175 [Myxobolus squamalis]